MTNINDPATNANWKQFFPLIQQINIWGMTKFNFAFWVWNIVSIKHFMRTLSCHHLCSFLVDQYDFWYYRVFHNDSPKVSLYSAHMMTGWPLFAGMSHLLTGPGSWLGLGYWAAEAGGRDDSRLERRGERPAETTSNVATSTAGTGHPQPWHYPCRIELF